MTTGFSEGRFFWITTRPKSTHEKFLTSVRSDGVPCRLAADCHHRPVRSNVSREMSSPPNPCAKIRCLRPSLNLLTPLRRHVISPGLVPCKFFVRLSPYRHFEWSDPAFSRAWCLCAGSRKEKSLCILRLRPRHPHCQR